MVVYTGGTFDVPHFGHVNFLRQCAKIGEVVVSLNTDKFVKKYKGEKPLFSYEERSKLLRLSGYVSHVIENVGGSDSKPAISSVKPNFIAIGTDWATKDYYKQMDFTQDWLDFLGITLIYIPYTDIISTTEIKRRCKL